MNAPCVLISPEEVRERDGPWVERLVSSGFRVIYPEDARFSTGTLGAETTVRELARCVAVVAGAEFYDEPTFAALPHLRVVARAGVGYDRVDTEAATVRSVAVTITPNANHESVAEHALGLLLSVTREIGACDREIRTGGWRRRIVRPLRGCTLGLLGLGRIGRSLAVRARALGMTVIAHDVAPDRTFAETNGVEIVNLDALLSRSDYLSLHCPLTDETRGILDRVAISRMRDGAIVINTARGDLVVEEDLVAALRSGKLGGAGLDVYRTEPLTPDHPLVEIETVVLTPHIASADSTSIEQMAFEAADSIARLAAGVWPQGAVVNDSIRQSWRWSPIERCGDGR